MPLVRKRGQSVLDYTHQTIDTKANLFHNVTQTGWTVFRTTPEFSVILYAHETQPSGTGDGIFLWLWCVLFRGYFFHRFINANMQYTPFDESGNHTARVYYSRGPLRLNLNAEKQVLKIRLMYRNQAFAWASIFLDRIRFSGPLLTFP